MHIRKIRKDTKSKLCQPIWKFVWRFCYIYCTFWFNEFKSFISRRISYILFLSSTKDQRPSSYQHSTNFKPRRIPWQLKYHAELGRVPWNVPAIDYIAWNCKTFLSSCGVQYNMTYLKIWNIKFLLYRVIASGHQRNVLAQVMKFKLRQINVYYILYGTLFSMNIFTRHTNSRNN